MKAALWFNLPEEDEDFVNAKNGSSYKSVLQDLDHALRSKLKYEDLEEARAKEVETIRELLHELLDKSDVRLWE